VRATYGRDFVAGILAGFEETLEPLIAGVGRGCPERTPGVKGARREPGSSAGPAVGNERQSSSISAGVVRAHSERVRAVI
jgi:hypothetical protein